MQVTDSCTWYYAPPIKMTNHIKVNTHWTQWKKRLVFKGWTRQRIAFFPHLVKMAYSRLISASFLTTVTPPESLSETHLATKTTCFRSLDAHTVKLSAFSPCNQLTSLKIWKLQAKKYQSMHTLGTENNLVSTQQGCYLTHCVTNNRSYILMWRHKWDTV